MNYFAVSLGADGGVVHDHQTGEIKKVVVGDFKHCRYAIQNAKMQLQHTSEYKGVLIKGDNQGGFFICDAQEIETL